ncbi:MAG: DUF1998 domain-containing protein [Chloroflexi bacterium]|nr:DUF1998 domain-containing protein [Chloroflexota bacterium]MYD98113.1 DUF1998 domain-containing protein [Gammaproteobacteria bacterium]
MTSPPSGRTRYKSTRVGGIRPSQMIHAYGPGALVDLPQLSVILSGVDGWDINHTERLIEPRLIGAVRELPGCHGVAEFRTPPWEEETTSPFDSWARTGLPVYPFPRWLRCTRCNLLAPVDRQRFQIEVPVYRPDRARYFHDKCHNRRPSAVPARFLVACPAGHLDDFPWEVYVHAGEPCSGVPILELEEAGKASRATDVRVTCKGCGAQRHLQEAFNVGTSNSLPLCRGRHPHLQRFDGECDQPTRPLLLGASNAWFPVYRSALTIPTVTGEIEQAVADHWDVLKNIEDSASLFALIRFIAIGAGEKRLQWMLNFDPEDVWATIAGRRSGSDEEASTADLRGPEWEAFTAAIPPKSPDFSVRGLGVPDGFEGTLGHYVAVDRLREVQALCGFTRIDGPNAGEAARIAPIWETPQRWLPAAEVRGEGILITLPEALIEKWETAYRDSDHFRDLRQGTRTWRARRGLDPSEGAPIARFVLLHTISHLLMRQVALECGYSAASIRERLYCREADDPEGPSMAGILLYTAAPDSEGTLGGLVALAEPARLGAVLRDALDRARLCSTDPMCASHRAVDPGDSLHNAACHACLFAPETSCEAGNRQLDRGTAVPILGRQHDSYFQ